jgi:parvulin-like peptidyl-prolyl isomerase
MSAPSHPLAFAGALAVAGVAAAAGAVFWLRGDDQGARQAMDPAAIVATVNGAEIRAAAVDAQYVSALRTFDGAKAATADASGRAAVRAQLLGGLIQFELLERAAAERGITVDAADLARQRASLMRGAGGEAAYAARLRGIPASVVRQQLRQAALEDELIMKLAADVRPPEAELLAFYETNRQTRFGPSVVARHILVADEGAARTVLDRLGRGEAFGAVAAAVSLDKATAANGGRLGTIRRGWTLSAITDALFAARPGTLVGPVRTELGVHVLEVVKRQPSPTYRQARTEIRDQMAHGRGLQLLADLIDREASEADVRVDEAFGRWAPAQGIVLPPNGST